MEKYRGKVWNYRGDSYPIIDSPELDIGVVLTEYRVKPKIGEEIEFVIITRHGNVAHARRMDDF